MYVCPKFWFYEKKDSSKKINYECRVYESVDDKHFKKMDDDVAGKCGQVRLWE